MKALEFLKRKFPLWEVQGRLEFNTVCLREEKLIEVIEEYARDYAAWRDNQVIGGRTAHNLWTDYQEEKLPRV